MASAKWWLYYRVGNIFLYLIDVICFISPVHFYFLVTWWKGIRDVAETGRSYVESDGDFYRFVLKKTTLGDSGTYIIKASNCHGSQKAYCTVRVFKKKATHKIA